MDASNADTAPTPAAGPGDAGIRFWSAAVLAASVLLFVLGGGLRNLRNRTTAEPPVSFPVALEPARGTLPEPPTHFRWTPGREGATAQVVLHRRSYEAFWSSAPVVGTSELDVPLSAYDGIAAGELLMWRVREAYDGKPLGSSDYVRFAFRVDNHGYGPGQAPAVSEYLK